MANWIVFPAAETGEENANWESAINELESVEENQWDSSSVPLQPPPPPPSPSLCEVQVPSLLKYNDPLIVYFDAIRLFLYSESAFTVQSAKWEKYVIESLKYGTQQANSPFQNVSNGFAKFVVSQVSGFTCQGWKVKSIVKRKKRMSPQDEEEDRLFLFVENIEPTRDQSVLEDPLYPIQPGEAVLEDEVWLEAYKRQ